MTPGSLLFGLCSVVCVVGALITVLARNPVRGALGLLATIIGIAGLFLKLSAEFLAAIQLIVYAGAVVVLFVFVLMLLGPAAARAPVAAGKSKIFRALSGVLMFLVAALGLRLLHGADSASPTVFGDVAAGHGSVEAVGGLMFSKAIAAFELTTALLIVAVVGAIAVARGKQGAKKAQRRISSPRDFFVGPLHPRDAERPLGKPASAASKGAAE